MNYFWGQHGPKGQHRPKVNNLGEISKFLTFHLIDLKFEEDIFIFLVSEFKQPIIFEVNIGPRSTTKVVFLKSSIFIQLN